jgi:hypothetical protein
MGVSGKLRASRHDVARTGCVSAYVASPQFNFDSNGDVAAAAAPRIVVRAPLGLLDCLMKVLVKKVTRALTAQYSGALQLRRHHPHA